MKLLLTSAGVKNPSIQDALVDLLGKPIAESTALIIPTAAYGHPMRLPGPAFRFITGLNPGTPLCDLGWKSLGLLELTALPSIDEKRWLPMVQEVDALLVSGGDSLYLAHWMRESGLAGPLAVARRGLGGPERRKHGDGSTDRRALQVLEPARRWGRSAGDRRLLDLPAPRSPRPAGEHHGGRRTLGRQPVESRRTRSTTTRPSRWSTATSRSISEGHWRLFAPQPVVA